MLNAPEAKPRQRAIIRSYGVLLCPPSYLFRIDRSWPAGDTLLVTEIQQVPPFRWHGTIRSVDRQAQGRAREARILVRRDRLRLGLPGDWKSVGEGVFELRIFEGKGYRVYFAREGRTVVILLCGGDESPQDRDIALAKSCWREYRRQS